MWVLVHPECSYNRDASDCSAQHRLVVEWDDSTHRLSHNGDLDSYGYGKRGLI
jgi:hypothetical protein